MSDDKLKQKGRGDQDQFFRKMDEELLQKLRQRALQRRALEVVEADVRQAQLS